MNEIKAALGLKEDASDADVLKAIKSLQANLGNAQGVKTELKGEIVELKATIVELKQEAKSAAKRAKGIPDEISELEVLAKMQAGLTREQAIEAIRSQQAHDAGIEELEAKRLATIGKVVK